MRGAPSEVLWVADEAECLPAAWQARGVAARDGFEAIWSYISPQPGTLPSNRDGHQEDGWTRSLLPGFESLHSLSRGYLPLIWLHTSILFLMHDPQQL